MRTPLVCVLLVLIVQRGCRAEGEFRPTPIPLSEWQFESEGRTREPAAPAPPPAQPLPAPPTHYWEDALRHSVYLTLVRDKIDELIAKGQVIAPNTKPSQPATVVASDDHNLWEKIKSAPFTQTKYDGFQTYGDITVMATGRLMEDNDGFRFVEDKPCFNSTCLEGAKAIWSVKRIRQKDDDSAPDQNDYHYELTFSVISQSLKRQRKPYENPVRTFTVRESTPERVVEMPQEHRSNERAPVTARPGRATWFHKNIEHEEQSRRYQSGLDRLFSSLFSDDDDVNYDKRPRYRPQQISYPHMPPMGYTQHSKAAYVGSPSDQQKRLTTYPYKQGYKYSHPIPPAAPPHAPHHYGDADVYPAPNHPFGNSPDYRYHMSKPTKPTRPAVLPTPIAENSAPKNWTYTENTNKNNTITETTTKVGDIITGQMIQTKPLTRPMPYKIHYMPAHVRPPVYNAPPGVFVTMDKKPFKPMPPLKYMPPTKHSKLNKPIDFRPSPQVLDMQQFSEPDPLKDTAFRPITWNYSYTNTTEKIEVAESNVPLNTTKKSITKGKKPPKKHENIKAERGTTSVPEIITAGSSEDNDSLEWANIVGAFSKTTPMVSQKETTEIPPTTSTITTTTTHRVPVLTTRKRKRTRTTTTVKPEEVTTTTQKPTKRTRPPPKFNKTTEKIKKHKRVTTTKAPKLNSTQDLTPQSSSAAATKPYHYEPYVIDHGTTALDVIPAAASTSTTTTTTTTVKPTTSTTKPTTKSTTTTTTESQTATPTSQPKSKTKNRFRQSTLLTKGTSVNHDKWTGTPIPGTAPEKLRNPTQSKFPRRKGSNFQGYVTSSTKHERDENDNSSIMKLTTESSKTSPLTVQIKDQDRDDNVDVNKESFEDDNVQDEYEDDEEDVEEAALSNEYLFPSTTLSAISNEIIEPEQVVPTLYTAPKNKSKCKKKHHNSTSEAPAHDQQNEEQAATTQKETTTEKIEDFFDFLTEDSISQKATSPPTAHEEQESSKHDKFVKIDKELQSFLDSLNNEDNDFDEPSETYDDDATDDSQSSLEDDESPFNNDQENAEARDSDGYDIDYTTRPYADPYSLLELFSME